MGITKVFGLFGIIIFLSCNPAPQKQKPESENLLQAVVEVHDVAMPKIKKLERLQREAKKELDSIQKQKPNNLNQLRKEKLEGLIKDLNYASFAMDEWMNGFVYDSLNNDEPKRIAYLKLELEKATKMKNAVINGIQKGDSLFVK